MLHDSDHLNKFLCGSIAFLEAFELSHDSSNSFCCIGSPNALIPLRFTLQIISLLFFRQLTSFGITTQSSGSLLSFLVKIKVIFDAYAFEQEFLLDRHRLTQPSTNCLKVFISCPTFLFLSCHTDLLIIPLAARRAASVALRLSFFTIINII